VQAPLGLTIAQATNQFKGKVQNPAPIIVTEQDTDVQLTVTNVGLVIRPDLDDSHTVHWHGFRNPNSIFDGVPEASIAVPVGRDFTYLFRPHDAGTYMYHCHFEDVEHVQMGMTGIVLVRPPMGAKFAYDHASTEFDREFCLLLNEIDTRPHDNLQNVQEFQWTNYDPNYYVINGRAYPHTIRRNIDPALPRQPISSLVQANPGDRMLLRFANLGYEQHTMDLYGIPMHVIGEDATLLRGRDGTDLSYWASGISFGPGESRDVLFDAPPFDASKPRGTDGIGRYNVYRLQNRNAVAQSNNGARGLGGHITQVRVYEDSPLAPQSQPNETPGVIA
jgi:FtsP/CotA-like multicopper oxidase with cupredoxin domain